MWSTSSLASRALAAVAVLGVMSPGAAAQGPLGVEARGGQGADAPRLRAAHASWLHGEIDRIAGAGLLAPRAAAGLTAQVHRTTGPLATSRTAAAADDEVAAAIGVPTRDLDGRGGGDVLDVRTLSAKAGRTLSVHARDGLTGRVLWSRTDRQAMGDYTFVTTLATSATRDLVLLGTYGSKDESATLTLTALDGATGRALWKVLRSGRYASDDEAFGVDALPGIAGVLEQPGGGQDLVLTATDFRESADGFSGTVQAFAVRSDGRLRGLGPEVTSDVGVPSAWPVRDATGDARGDVVVLAPGGSSAVVGDPRRPVPDSLVELRSGSDARAAWSRTDLVLELGHGAYAVGPVAGPKAGGRAVSDIAVSGGYRYQRAPGMQGALGRPTTTDSPLTVLRATDGSTVFAGLGDVAVAGGEGTVVTMLTRVVETRRSTETTLVLTSHGPDGAQLWQQSRTHGSAEGFEFVAALMPTTLAGDLQPDGRGEPFYYFAGFGPEGISFFGGVLDGRTGEDLEIDPQFTLGSGGSLTGKGDDVVTVAAGKGGVTLTGLRGATGSRLWQRTLVSPAPEDHAYAYAGAARGRCSDVLVDVSGQGRTMLAALASDGRPRWTVTRAERDLGPGRVVAGAPLTARCG